MNEIARGSLLVLAASLGFATLGTLSVIAYDAGMSPPTFVTLRATLGALLLGLLLALRPKLWAPLRRLARREQAMLTIAVIVNGVFNLALFAAFGSLPVGIVLAVYFTYPVVVWLASLALRRERLTAARTIAVLLAMSGIALILSERLGGAETAPIGFALAASATLCQASYIVVARHGFPSVSAEQAITLVLAGGAVMAGVAALMAEAWTAFVGAWTASAAPWLAIIAAAVLGTAAAKVAVLRGLRLLGGTRTAVIMLVEPVGGVALAFVVLGQAITLPEAAGGLLILAAAVSVQASAAARPGGE